MTIENSWWRCKRSSVTGKHSQGKTDNSFMVELLKIKTVFLMFAADV